VLLSNPVLFDPPPLPHVWVRFLTLVIPMCLSNTHKV